MARVWIRMANECRENNSRLPKGEFMSQDKNQGG